MTSTMLPPAGVCWTGGPTAPAEQMLGPDAGALVLEHLRLLPVIARRLGLRASAVADHDDYIQAGAVGLLLAARAHDSTRVSFAAFAWTCAANEMLAAAQAASWQRRARPRPDRRLAPLDPATAAAMLADPAGEDPAEAAARTHQRTVVRDAVEALPPVLRAVVRAYWFDGLQQRDIAARLGVTQSRVSQLLRQAYRLLAPALHDPAGDPVPPTPQGVAA